MIEGLMLLISRLVIRLIIERLWCWHRNKQKAPVKQNKEFSIRPWPVCQWIFLTKALSQFNEKNVGF